MYIIQMWMTSMYIYTQLAQCFPSHGIIWNIINQSRWLSPESDGANSPLLWAKSSILFCTNQLPEAQTQTEGLIPTWIFTIYSLHSQIYIILPFSQSYSHLSMHKRVITPKQTLTPLLHSPQNKINISQQNFICDCRQAHVHTDMCECI